MPFNIGVTAYARPKNEPDHPRLRVMGVSFSRPSESLFPDRNDLRIPTARYDMEDMATGRRFVCPIDEVELLPA